VESAFAVKTDHLQSDVALWLTRTALASVLAAMVWAVRFFVAEPGYIRMLAAAQDSEVQLLGQQVHFLAAITPFVGRGALRATSVASRKIRSNATPRAERMRLADSLARVTAEDSARFSALDLLGLRASRRRYVVAREIMLARERRLWEALGRDDARGFQRAVDDFMIAKAGLDAIEARDSIENAEQSQRADSAEAVLKWNSLRALGAAVVFIVGFVIMQAFAGFAFTGRWEWWPVRLAARRLDGGSPR